MKTLFDVMNTKVEQVSKQNLDRGQKRKRISAFIKNVFAVIELISEREKKRPDIEFHYISQDKFKNLIKRDVLRAEVMEFLKQNNIIDVYKREGKEYYIHFEHEELGIKKQPKGYKITEYGHKILNEATNDSKFKELMSYYKITKKQIKKYTPEDVMKQYTKEDYYLKTRTRENIEKVINNNLELEFHPLSDEEMVKIYKEEKKDLGDEDIKMQLDIVKDYFANKEFTYNIRLYSAFTNTPKCWRRFVTNRNGEKIVELFDIHSSVMNILPLVCRTVFAKRTLSKEKFDKFLLEEKKLDNILQGDVYKQIGGNIFSREEIKKQLMHVVFSNNEFVKKITYTPKGKLRKSASNQIKKWLSENLPIMYEILSNFEQRKQGGKKKSMFWYHFQKMETELMVNLNGIFSDKLKTTIYNIHDGLFVKQSFNTLENKRKCKLYYKAIKEKLAKQIMKGN